MKNNGMIKVAISLGLFLLASCGLPLVTPPVEANTPTEVPFLSTIIGNPSPTTAPIPAPVEITAKNASSLTAAYISALSNAQQIKWSSDSLELAASTQNMDAAGNQLFGVTLLGVPDLQPKDIYTTQSNRVSDLASDGKKAVLVALDQTSFSVIDLSAGNATLFSVAPGYLIGNVTFSADASMLAVSKMDAMEVVLYSAVDGNEIKTLSGFETAAPIYQAGFKESPQWIVWFSRATLQLQEIQTGTLGPRLEHSDFITAYALSQDGSMVASVASTSSGDVSVPAITIWDAELGVQLNTLILSGSTQCLTFSPNGSLLAVGIGNSIQIWDVTGGTLIASLEGHTGMIASLAFSPDGKYLASAAQDNQLFLWQVSE